MKPKGKARARRAGAARKTKGDAVASQPLWRYFTLEGFLDFYLKRRLKMTSLARFSDRCEGLVVSEDDLERAPEGGIRVRARSRWTKASAAYRRRMFASCWTIKPDEDHALWRIYAGNARGVAIRTDADRIRRALAKVRPKGMVEGSVAYEDEIDFRNEPLVATAFRKRAAFASESEYRFVFDFNRTKGSEKVAERDWIFVPVDPDDLIEGVSIGFGYDADTAATIEELFRAIGIRREVVQSKI
jgi:hypothetical protein